MTAPAQLSTEAQRMVAEARVRFRDGVEESMGSFRRLADAFEAEVGTVSSEEALDAWRQVCITSLKQRQTGGL